MTDVENKTEIKEAEYTRGVRGEIGTATAADTVKQRYHATHYNRVDAEDKRNPNKKRWIKNTNAPSLKQFARKLMASGDANAKDFMANKHGAKDAKRSEANIASTKAAAAATKMGRKATKK
jgi:hypothetical protein